MTLKLGRYMPLVRCIGVWFSVRWICLSSAACCSLQYTCGSGELSGGAISALLAKKWAKTSGHCRVQQKEGTEQNTARNRISEVRDLREKWGTAAHLSSNWKAVFLGNKSNCESFLQITWLRPVARIYLQENNR